MAGPWDAVVAYWGDPLQGKPAAEIAAFYRRLGVFIESVVGAGNSASSRFLLHWLDGKGAPLTADASVISDLPEVKAYLANEVRTVFLTRKQIHKTGRWGGIGPRLKRSPPFDKTPPQDAAGNYPMMYEGPPVGTITQMKFAEIMKRYSETKTITEQEKRYLDVFTSFHKFGIKSDVVVSARPGAGPAGAGVYRIEFVSWTSTAFDTYNWNYDLGFPVPNPDFGSKDAKAIAADKEVVVIRHAHAKTVKDAGLAQDFEVKTTPWSPMDATINGPDSINLARLGI